MKIKTSPIGFVLLALLSILVSTKVSNAQSLIETTGATGISNTLDGRTVNPPQIREKIRADLDSKMQNAKNNQEFFALQNAPQKTMELCLSHPPLHTQHRFCSLYSYVSL